MVQALFVRADSPYVDLLGAENCWDIGRDATRYCGPEPVIAHPPCRAWGQLRAMAKPRAGERELAIWAIWAARQWGGVVEHPAGSLLWSEFGLTVGASDAWGGMLARVAQCDWGHRAQKSTCIYVVSRRLGRIAWPTPPMPGAWTVPVERMGRAERERTPLEFARYLVEIAEGC